MTDTDVIMRARRIADAERRSVSNYGSAIEDGREGDVALAILVAASAICAELRVLSMVIDYSAVQQ